MTLPATPGSVRRVRVRLLPWRPRWRSKDTDLPDVSGLADVGDIDDPFAAVVLVVAAVVLAPFLLLFVVGVVLLSFELLLLLALVPLALLGQLLGLLPWYLVVTTQDGVRHAVQAGSTAKMVAARRYYRSLRA